MLGPPGVPSAARERFLLRVHRSVFSNAACVRSDPAPRRPLVLPTSLSAPAVLLPLGLRVQPPSTGLPPRVRAEDPAGSGLVFWAGGSTASAVSVSPVSSSPGPSLPPSLPFLSPGNVRPPPPSSIPGNSNNPSCAAEPIKAHRQSHKFQTLLLLASGRGMVGASRACRRLLAHASPGLTLSSPSLPLSHSACPS